MPIEQYRLAETTLLPEPTDLPEGYIAYNPSGIWTTESKSGRHHDIMYARVEPDRSCPDCSHLGKSRVRPYIIDVKNLDGSLKPYPEADEIIGEDPALTRINRRLGSGAIETVWLLSCVDAQPYPDRPDQVMTLHTKFFAGDRLDALEHIADGPECMKDIRVSQVFGSTALHIYGRPQPRGSSGNITHRTIAGIEDLTAEAISDAPYIDENLFPINGGVWGGVNDVISSDPDRNLLIAHRAWRTGEDGAGRHYESVLYGHNVREKRIVDMGLLATTNMFPAGKKKADETVELGDVVFAGGGYNGGLGIITQGVRDGSIGIGRVQKR